MKISFALSTVWIAIYFQTVHVIAGKFERGLQQGLDFFQIDLSPRLIPVLVNSVSGIVFLIFVDELYFFLPPSDNEITWWLPNITESSPLAIEFVIDFCDYCEKYGGENFNPIDSFIYT